MYSLLLALIYLAFISLGLPDSLLGSGWPVMHLGLGVSVSSMGVITMIISGGTILSSLFSDRLTRRFGTRHVTVFSVFLTAVALFGFSLSRQFWQLILFAVPYGLGAGAIDAALNNFVAIHFSPRHMSWLHCFWGVGAIASPFVMGYALTRMDWHGGYRIIAIVQSGIALLLLITLPVWKVCRDPAPAGTTGGGIGLIATLKIRGVPTLLLGFFAYCAAEATVMAWAGTYLVEARGIAAETAARFNSLFYIGIALGRFLSGFVTKKLGDRNMIRLGSAVLFCGIALLVIPAGSAALPLIALGVIGFGCAPIYPSIIHATPENFGAEHSGSIIGIQMASAYVGSTLMPPLFGLLAARIGFRLFPLFLICFFITVPFLIGVTFRVTARRTPAAENAGNDKKA